MKPEFLIIGCPKAGTSSLHDWLNKHPSLTGTTPKETYFFLDDSFQKNIKESFFNCGDEWEKKYETFFSILPSNKTKTFESTVQNIYCNRLIKLAPTVNENLKVIIILRDPLKRALSTYNYYKNNKALDGCETTFDGFLESLLKKKTKTDSDVYNNTLEWSRYDKYIKQWERSIGRNSIFVTSLEEMSSSIYTVLNRIEDFLELPRYFSKDVKLQAQNTTFHVKNMKLHKALKPFANKIKNKKIRTALIKIYRAVNSRQKNVEYSKINQKRFLQAVDIDIQYLESYDVKTKLWKSYEFD